MTLITPRTLSGTMELLPRRQAAFDAMVQTVTSTYASFGFQRIETPVFERTEVLLGKSGGETEKQVYFVQSTGALEQGNAPDMALRFDLTVPTARYVAEHEHDLAFPFRRFQIQRVYRGERAQKGRYREFLQCDADIIGRQTLSVHHDAEVVALVNTVLTKLDIGAFTIGVNNRKVLKGFLNSVGVTEPERQTAIVRVVDMIEKVGIEKVASLLTAREIGLETDTAETLLTFINFTGTVEDTLDHLDRFETDDEEFQHGVEELRTVAGDLAAYGVAPANWSIDLRIARGLDYYTGTVFETQLVDQPKFGSVCSGGRYDNLAELYTKTALPGVGLSIGLTRLFAALEDGGLVDDEASTVDVVMTRMDDALAGQYLAMATQLRAAGINVAVYGDTAKFGKQLKYADAVGANVAVIMGSREADAGEVVVKKLHSGEQTTTTPQNLVAVVNEAIRNDV